MEKRNQKLILAFAGFCLSFLIFICPVWADVANPWISIEIPSSPNPVGSGARALGMGGAFIAIADDATAASWNPGGLIQLEKPEISAVFGYLHRRESNTFGDHPEASGSKSVEDYHLNYLSVAYPFEINKPKVVDGKVVQKGPRRNMILSLNYQRMYDFNRAWHYKWDYSDGDAMLYDYEQEGSLYALGLAYCVQVTTDLSLGITLNDWGYFLLENQWKQSYKQTWHLRDGSRFHTVKNDEFSFRGWNMNLGFLWRLDEHWTLGAVFKTPFTGDIDYAISGTIREVVPGEDDRVTPQPLKHYDKELHFPMSYGMGLAYRHSDNLTLSGDVYRTHWNDFELRDSEGNRLSPVSGRDMDKSDIDATTWFRLGGEYLIIGERVAVPLRAGIFYDPGPAEGSPDNYYGFSLGTGLVYKRFVFDIAYQFRFGNDVGSSYMAEELNFSQDMREHTVYSSLIIHF